MTFSAVFVSVLSSDTATDSIGSFVDIFNVCLYASPLALAWKVGVRRYKYLCRVLCCVCPTYILHMYVRGSCVFRADLLGRYVMCIW